VTHQVPVIGKYFDIRPVPMSGSVVRRFDGLQYL